MAMGLRYVCSCGECKQNIIKVVVLMKCSCEIEGDFDDSEIDCYERCVKGVILTGLVRNRSDFDSSGSVSEMTYIVSGGALNSTHLVNRKRVLRFGLRPKWTEPMSRFSSVQYGGRVYAKITKL